MSDISISSIFNCSSNDDHDDDCNAEKDQLQGLRGALADLEYEKKIAENAKKSVDDSATAGSNPHINTLKEKGYGSYFGKRNDSAGLDSLTDTLDSLIEEAKEDLQLAKDEIAKEKQAGVASSDSDGDSDNDSDSSSATITPQTYALSRKSTHSGPAQPHNDKSHPAPDNNKPLSKPTEFIADTEAGEAMDIFDTD